MCTLDGSGEKIEGDSFVLFVYTSGCTSCAQFESTILNRYIKDNEVKIYKIEHSLLDGLVRTPLKYKVNPRIIIFKDGDVYTQTSIERKRKVFTVYEDFCSYISDYVTISNKVEITTITDLDHLKENNNEYVLYFGWSVCGDCNYLESHALKSFISNSNYKKFYYF